MRRTVPLSPRADELAPTAADGSPGPPGHELAPTAAHDRSPVTQADDLAVEVGKTSVITGGRMKWRLGGQARGMVS
jgi:hypothetical protein